jgi:hypothetical protein
MEADNGKEFKGALLILLRKYGIKVVNGAPRSPQTQGLVEQANGVVENKLRVWKMDHGSTEWKDGLLEVTLAMNTQIHSTIACAPAELLFRERTSYIDCLIAKPRRISQLELSRKTQLWHLFLRVSSSLSFSLSSKL